MLKSKKSDRWRKKCDQSTPVLIKFNANNILQAEAEKLSGFTPSIIQPEAAGRGLYARCKTR